MDCLGCFHLLCTLLSEYIRKKCSHLGFYVCVCRWYGFMCVCGVHLQVIAFGRHSFVLHSTTKVTFLKLSVLLRALQWCSVSFR